MILQMNKILYIIVLWWGETRWWVLFISLRYNWNLFFNSNSATYILLTIFLINLFLTIWSQCIIYFLTSNFYRWKCFKGLGASFLGLSHVAIQFPLCEILIFIVFVSYHSFYFTIWTNSKQEIIFSVLIFDT